jgi:putative two-component system response regulator
VDAFVELQNEFRVIAARFADSDADMAAKAKQLDVLKGAPAAAT